MKQITTTSRTSFAFMALAVTCFLLGTQITHAERDAEYGLRAQFEDELQNTTPAERAKLLREQRLSQFEEHVQNRILNLGENMVTRMVAAADRLINIANRLDARMAIIEESGTDLSEQRTMVKNTLSMLEGIHSELGGVMVNIESMLYSDSPRELFRFTKTTFLDLKDKLTLAQTQLRHALEQTKSAIRATQNDQGGQGGDEAPQATDAGAPEETGENINPSAE